MRNTVKPQLNQLLKWNTNVVNNPNLMFYASKVSTRNFSIVQQFISMFHDLCEWDLMHPELYNRFSRRKLSYPPTYNLTCEGKYAGVHL